MFADTVLPIYNGLNPGVILWLNMIIWEWLLLATDVWKPVEGPLQSQVPLKMTSAQVAKTSVNHQQQPLSGFQSTGCSFSFKGIPNIIIALVLFQTTWPWSHKVKSYKMLVWPWTLAWRTTVRADPTNNLQKLREKELFIFKPYSYLLISPKVAPPLKIK